MTDLGELHASAHLPPLTVVSPGPDLPVGSVGVIGTFLDTVDDFVALPFQLQVDDWIVCINTPLDVPYQTLVLTGCLVNAHNSPWTATDTMTAGVSAYRVSSVTGPVTIGTAGTSRCRAWLAAYRGLIETDVPYFPQVSLQWIQGNSLLQATQGPVTYSAPAAQVVRVAYANAYPELCTLSYNPGGLPYWFEETIEPAGHPAINPNYRIYYAFFSGDDPSPTEEQTVTSTWASWDIRYESGWGEITFYTFIFNTQTVLFLDDDPLNAGPAGPDRLPG